MAGSSFDHVLVAAQRGDEDAFARLWRSVNPSLVRYLGVLAGSAGEDIAAEVWLQVVRSLRTFRGDEGRFRAWLFTIARNKVTDWRRTQARRPAEPLDDLTAGTLVADADTAAAALERVSTDAALALLATLPPEAAELILLRVVAGLDVATTARIVGRTPAAVRVAAHRALRRLAQTLARAGVRPGDELAGLPAPRRPSSPRVTR